MTIYFHKFTELKCSNYVTTPLRSSAILSIENDDKYCLIWPVLASLHPCEINHPKRVSNFREYVDELNIDGLVFNNGFKCSNVQIFEKLNKLSIF